MFSAVLILILLTEMLIYAVQVGVFEQRKSGNEMRQKRAFHAAETGIQFAQEYLLSKVRELPSQGADGWLFDGISARWLPCPVLRGTGTHPCYGEPLEALRDKSYFYSFGSDPDKDQIPIMADEVLPESEVTVEVHALLCLLDVDRTPGVVPPVKGCLAKNDPKVNNIYFIVTLLGRGKAECDIDGKCAAEALIAQKLGSFGPLTGAGGPGVPLTSRSSFPPGGSAQIVPNPNGGGPGVPISTWLNGNPSTDDLCTGGVDPLDPIGGNWSTCERHEWYGVDEMPDEDSPNGKYTCPTANCSCQGEREISTDAKAGIDIVIDPLFPCDLFEYTFRKPRSEYPDVKDDTQVIYDCDILGPTSKGTYWVDGSVGTCDLSGKSIGSPDDPVFIISAADLTKTVGNTKIYGVLLITDVEGNNAAMHAAGINTIYGAVLIEGAISHFQGTFQIVYNDDLIEQATKSGSLGKIYGGWTDFHSAWR